MQYFIKIATRKHNELVDITQQIEDVVLRSGVQQGLLNVYVRGATAGIMKMENLTFNQTKYFCL
jgi:thiamine phosphate synthase YjbQ (UPF0047 family)